MVTFGRAVSPRLADAQPQLENFSRRCVSEPPVRRAHTEVECTMQVFGVQLDIDAAEHHRRREVSEDRDNVQVQPRHRTSARRCVSELPARRSHTEVEGAMLVFGVGLDIDAAEHQRRRVFRDRSVSNAQVLPDADVPHSWDLPLNSDSRQAKVARRPFWEQTHWTDQWAQLMDRPRRGNRNSVWQEEAQPIPNHDELPADVRARLREIEYDLQVGLAKKRGSYARPTSKPASLAAEARQKLAAEAKEPRVPKLWNSLYEADSSWQDSYLHSVDETKPPGSSRASTASGDAQLAPSPDVMSTTPGTVTPVITDSDSDDGVFHLVNDPKGKHALLRQANNDIVAASCKPLGLPLGLRRVMCAVLPADAEESIELSSSQMRKLTGLRGALQTQKNRPSARRAAPKWH